MYESCMTFKLRIANKVDNIFIPQSRATLCLKLMFLKHVFVSLSTQCVDNVSKNKYTLVVTTCLRTQYIDTQVRKSMAAT